MLAIKAALIYFMSTKIVQYMYVFHARELPTGFMERYGLFFIIGLAWLRLRSATGTFPLATCHSPFATHPSPLAPRHSPLATKKKATPKDGLYKKKQFS